MRIRQLLLGFLVLVFLPLHAADGVSDLFGTAWSKFSKGELKAANQIVDQSLERPNLTNRERARFLYLKSHLLAKQPNQTSRAIATMEDSIALMAQTGSPQGVFLGKLGLAKIYLEAARSSEANTLLEECHSLGLSNGFQMGYLYQLLAQSSRHLGHMDQAILYTADAFDAYREEGNLMGQLNSRADMGYYLMLAGYWEEGYRETLVAREMIASNDAGMGKATYLILNTILYERCHGGQATSYLEGMVSDYARAQGDVLLQKELHFVMSFDCTLAESIHGDGAPPPPPLLQ